MKDDLIIMFRPSSPRTGREIDLQWVPRKYLKKYIAAGWEIYRKQPKKEKPAPEPEIKKPKKKLSYPDFTELEIDNIRRDKRTLQTLAKVHNTTVYTIRKIKGRI